MPPNELEPAVVGTGVGGLPPGAVGGFTVGTLVLPGFSGVGVLVLVGVLVGVGVLVFVGVRVAVGVFVEVEPPPEVVGSSCGGFVGVGEFPPSAGVNVAVGVGVSVGAAVGGGTVSSRLALSTKTAPLTLLTCTATYAAPSGATCVTLCTENEDRTPACLAPLPPVSVKSWSRNVIAYETCAFPFSLWAENENTYVAPAMAATAWCLTVD
jgi:hypothetical protein